MSRKKPTQLALPLPAPKFGHGSARKGAGHKPGRGAIAHVRRPRLNPRHPVHVTLKLVAGVPSLRGKDLFHCLRHAVGTARRQDLRIVHFAILSNHIHLIVEPTRSSLSREMQSLTLAIARRINARLRRRGALFLGRYHLRALRTPTEVKNALAYVLGNDAKHRDSPYIVVDPFSSALAFGEWRLLYGKPPRLRTSAWSDAFIEAWHSEILSPARTWLITEGWKKASTRRMRRKRGTSFTSGARSN